jgi:hypothetical protein
MERPTVRAVVSEGASWATLNVQRLPGLALAVSCLVLLIFLLGDRRYYVYGAQVTGNEIVPADVIYQASGADMHSVFFIAPLAVRQRLLEQLPALAEARVAVTLPGRLSIHVIEKKVQFVFEAGGLTLMADEHGTVLGGATASPDAFLIRCTDGGIPGDGRALDPAVLETVRGLSQLLGGQRTFEYSPRYGVSWRNGKGWLVRFGVGGDLLQKVAVMQSITAELADRGTEPQFLDVGVPSRPYYR